MPKKMILKDGGNVLIKREVSRPRGRPKKTDKPILSDDVLLTALRHFSKKGFEGASVREICSELGVSHNMINDRFGNKLELWCAAIDRWVSEITRGVENIILSAKPGTEPIVVLRSIIVGFVKLNADRPEILRIVNVEGSEDSERLTYLWNSHVLPFYELVSRYYLAAHKKKLVRTFPPTLFFFMLSHGATASLASLELARNVASIDTKESNAVYNLADPDEIELRAEFVADLLLAPPKQT